MACSVSANLKLQRDVWQFETYCLSQLTLLGGEAFLAALAPFGRLNPSTVVVSILLIVPTHVESVMSTCLFSPRI